VRKKRLYTELYLSKLIGGTVKSIPGSVYDWQQFVPAQANRALAALGIRAGVVKGVSGHMKGAMFTFSFVGDSEQAKYVVQTFLEDTYGGTNIRFYANPVDSTECYACFDWNKRWINGA
jgi:hypothetical protein